MIPQNVLKKIICVHYVTLDSQGRLDITPTFDRDTMNAIADNIDGLKQLSVERVWMEMGKISNGGNIQQILGAMDKTGVLDAIGLNYKPTHKNLWTVVTRLLILQELLMTKVLVHVGK